MVVNGAVDVEACAKAEGGVEGGRSEGQYLH